MSRDDEKALGGAPPGTVPTGEGRRVREAPAPGAGVAASTPDVTVVIAVYNGMPELTRCVTSALTQSLDPSRVEVVVVDDGSTDGTADELARLQALHLGRLHVVQQPPSGGPSRPRNVGLEQARGRYVFFLDADDHLAPQALERLVALADSNGADVVLGKIVKTGRKSPSVFACDQDDADLFSSRIIYTLNAQKLFRRSVLEAEPRIRFPEDLWTGEDAVFTMRAYLRAERISVLASYACYYKERRPGGGHVTSRPGAEPRLRALSALADVIAEAVEPGERRDALMVRPFKLGMTRWFGPRFLSFSPSEQEAAARLGRPMVQRWLTNRVAAQLTPLERLELHLVGIGRTDLLTELLQWHVDGNEPETVVHHGRTYLAYPFFRDTRISVPYSVFDVTSEGPPVFPVTALERSGPSSVHVAGTVTTASEGAVTVQLVLRDRHGGNELVVPAQVTSVTSKGANVASSLCRMSFFAEPDMSRVAHRCAIPPAVWDLYVEVTQGTVTKRGRLMRRRQSRVPAPASWVVTGTASSGGEAAVRVKPYFTQPHRGVSLRVEEATVSRTSAGRRGRLPATLASLRSPRRLRRLLAAARSVQGSPRDLAARLLPRLGLHVTPAQPGAVIVSRSPDLEVTRAPGRSFVVTPGQLKVRMRALRDNSFLAYSGNLAEIEANHLLPQGSGERRVVKLPTGAFLSMSRSLEKDRWIEHERAILGYVAELHIVGVLDTYGVNCVLDVGANRGQYAQRLRSSGYTGHIISFEPVPAIAEVLEKQAADDDKWTVHRVALGREDTVTTMHVVPVTDTLSSMLPPSEYGKLRFPTMSEATTIEVPVRRLDGMLDALVADIPDPRLYLKLDTQGFDLAVFEGLGERAEDIVAMQSELALMNIYDGMPRMPEVIEIYEAAGFEVSGLFPVSREFSTTRVLEYDCILVRASGLRPDGG